MKKILKLSRSLSWALLAIMALQAPGSAIAMEQEQPLSQRKQSLLRRLVANYTETRELHRKRKAGKASPEELKKLEERMKKIKKAAIKAGVIAAFITAIFGAKWAYGKYQTAQKEKQKEAEAAAMPDPSPDLSSQIEEPVAPPRAAAARRRKRETSAATKKDPLLFFHIKAGNLQAIEKILTQDREAATTRNQKGDTALHATLKNETFRSFPQLLKEIITKLLEAGADKNARDASGKTPLDIAQAMDLKIAIDLLSPKEAAAAPPRRPKSRAAAAVPAPSSDLLSQIDIISKKIDNLKKWYETTSDFKPMPPRGLSDALEKTLAIIRQSSLTTLNMKDKEGITPLLRIIDFASDTREDKHRPLYARIILELIDKRVDINAVDPRTGNTPLHLVAISYDRTGAIHPDIIEKLINKGANLKAKNRQNKTPFDVANYATKLLIERILRFYANKMSMGKASEQKSVTGKPIPEIPREIIDLIARKVIDEEVPKETE